MAREPRPTGTNRSLPRYIIKVVYVSILYVLKEDTWKSSRKILGLPPVRSTRLLLVISHKSKNNLKIIEQHYTEVFWYRYTERVEKVRYNHSCGKESEAIFD